MDPSAALELYRFGLYKDLILEINSYITYEDIMLNLIYHTIKFTPHDDLSDVDYEDSESFTLNELVQLGDTYNDDSKYKNKEIYVFKVHVKDVLSFNVFVWINNHKPIINNLHSRYDTIIDTHTLADTDAIVFKFKSEIKFDWIAIDKKICKFISQYQDVVGG